MMRIVRWRAPALARGMRIMSSDRVPGVKTVSGAPVRQDLSSEAQKGAERLRAMVEQQRRAAVREQEEASQLRAAEANGSGLTGLRRISSALDAHIDGQRPAKSELARALRRRVFGLDDHERPLRLVFAGPSGVGKTAMATAVCEALLGSCVPERNFKRFNLSEFSHPSKFNRLTGGDPNYVGYREGGELTNFVKQAEETRAKQRNGRPKHTSCVILLDEVDRAADGLLTFLMNFFDQGQLADGMGEVVDARHAVIVMTSNVGREAAIRHAKSGFADDAHEMARTTAAISAELLEHVCDGRHENLGRLGAVIPFLPLDAGGRAAVVRRQIEGVSARLARSHAELAPLTDALTRHVADRWDDDLGGRSTRDFIENHVVEAIADEFERSGRFEAAGASGTVVRKIGEAAAEAPEMLRLELALEGGEIVCSAADDADDDDHHEPLASAG